MEYFVIYLIKSKRYLALPKKWVQNPKLGEESKVFFSADTNDTPDFTCEMGYYLNKEVSACYDAYVYKAFDSIDAAERFASNKRITPPVQYKSLQKFHHMAGSNPVDFIEIDDDVDENEDDTVAPEINQTDYAHVRPHLNVIFFFV